MIRVVLADDHTILREGIRSLLNAEKDIQVVAEAEDGRTAVQLASELRPDVIIMDIAMPLLNGVDATCQIRRNCPDVQVLILTMYDDEELIRKSLGAGAMGYILKDAASQELIHAIRLIHGGEAILSPAITRIIIEDFLRWGDVQAVEKSDNLSQREREVLQLIAEGYSYRKISEILCISLKTVQAHRSNLMSKLEIHSRADLVKYAIQKKIIEV